jgi:hypothetical protein
MEWSFETQPLRFSVYLAHPFTLHPAHRLYTQEHCDWIQTHEELSLQEDSIWWYDYSHTVPTCYFGAHADRLSDGSAAIILTEEYHGIPRPSQRILQTRQDFNFSIAPRTHISILLDILKNSSVGIPPGYGMVGRKIRVWFPVGQGIIPLTASRPSLMPTYHPMQWLPGFFLGG